MENKATLDNVGTATKQIVNRQFKGVKRKLRCLLTYKRQACAEISNQLKKSEKQSNKKKFGGRKNINKQDKGRTFLWCDSMNAFTFKMYMSNRSNLIILLLNFTSANV